MIYLFSPSQYEGVENLPLIEFEIINDNINFEGVDVLLFTSKNSVLLLDDVTQDWKKIDTIAIGEESAKMVKKLGGKVVMQAKGYSKQLSEMIEDEFTTKKILYIRPQVVATDAIENLKSKVAISEFILYRTKCKQYESGKKPPLNSTLIFTSPSTVKCFLQNFDSLEGYKIVSIGTTTSQAIPQEVASVIPEVPTIQECIKVAIILDK